LGSKIYSGPINADTHESNVRSTDLSKAYFRRDGTIVNRDRQDAYETFHQTFNDTFSGSFSNLGGMVRLHLELPYVKSGGKTTMKAVGSEKTVRDIAIHIDINNVRSMFNETETLEVLEMATCTKFNY